VTNSLGSGYVGIASTKEAVSVLLYTDPQLKADPLMAGFGDLLNTAQKRLEAVAAGPVASLSQPGALPILMDWVDALGRPAEARLTPVKPFEAVECLSSEPGTKVQQEEVTVEGPHVQGGQVRFSIGADQDVDTAATGLADQLQGCSAGPGFKVSAVQGTSWPRTYSYTAGAAGSGWVAVVKGAHDVALIQIADPDHAAPIDSSTIDALASVATARLKRYGTGTSGSPTTSSPTVNGPKAIDEDMPVTGPDPRPSSKLFVAASQWTSKPLTGGARATAGPGALEGSTAIAQCETDKQQAGIGGNVGVVSVRAGSGGASYIGRQRVQVDRSTDPVVQKAYVAARLSEAKALYAKGCGFANGTVKSTPGPSAGTWRLDTVFTDGSPALSEWVGVTAQKTPGAVSTIVITKAADPKQGFPELDRLLNLARQK
jgi:hypothetical protein